MPDQGLSAADFRQRAAIGTLTKNKATVGAPDPMDQVLADSRKATAIHASGALVKNIQAEEREAENKVLEAEIKNQQLKELARPAQSQGQNEQWIGYILSKVDQTEKMLADARAEARQAEQQLLQTRLAMLTDELEKIRNEARSRPDPGDDFDVLTKKLDQAKALLDRFTPPPPPQIDAMPMIDSSLEKWKLQVDLEREKMRIEADDRRADRQIDYERQKAENDRAERLLDRQAEQQGRFMAETLPKITSEIMPLVRQFMTAQQALPQVAAQTQAVQPTIPEGFDVQLCQGCGYEIAYRKGLKTIICPSCGIIYGDATVITAPANGRQHQQENTNGTTAYAPTGADHREDDERAGSGVY